MKYPYLFAVVLLLGCLVLASGFITGGGQATSASTAVPDETPAPPPEKVVILPEIVGVTSIH